MEYDFALKNNTPLTGFTGIGSAGTLFYVFKLPSSMGAWSGDEKTAAETWEISAAVVHFFWKLDLFTMEELNNNKITLSGDAL